MAAVSAQPKTSVGGTIRLSDGTGTPVTLTLAYDKGDFSGGPFQEFLNDVIFHQRRGKFIGASWGDRLFPEYSFTLHGVNIVGSTAVAPGSALEFFTGKGAYASNISTLGANRIMFIDLRITVEGTDWGDAADETVDAEDCFCTVTSYEESTEGNSLSVAVKQTGQTTVINNSNTVNFTQVA